MSKFAGLLAAHPPLSATEIGEIARKPALDAGDFCRLTPRPRLPVTMTAEK
jgi:hypothetical protein